MVFEHSLQTRSSYLADPLLSACYTAGEEEFRRRIMDGSIDRQIDKHTNINIYIHVYMHLFT